MNGAMPYPDKSVAEVSKFVKEGGRMTPPDSMPKSVRDIMLDLCWPEDPNRRAAMRDIRNLLRYMPRDKREGAPSSEYGNRNDIFPPTAPAKE